MHEPLLVTKMLDYASRWHPEQAQKALIVKWCSLFTYS